MRPIIVHLGPLEVNSWGLMAALAFLAGWYVVGRELERQGGRKGDATGLVLGAAIGGFVGARLYFMAEQLGTSDLVSSLSGQGFTWYGGVLGGAAAVLLVARRKQIPMPLVLGSFAPALALGYAIGRLGCQLAGDGTYGTASDLPWAMSYPDGVMPTTERVHPTPIYSSLAGFAIFAVLWGLRKRVTPVRLFGIYLLLAGMERLLVEFIRRNDEVVLGLTQPQLFAIAAALGGLFLIADRRRIRLAEG